MRDPLQWSLPVGRYFGVQVRIHLFFFLFIGFQLLKGWTDKDHAPEGFETFFQFQLFLSCVLFFSVLLHEFGHCFAARAVGGDAQEILMWPLGGLAIVNAPNTALAQFITTVCGPLVNLVICLLTGILLVVSGFRPPLNPMDGLGGLVSVRSEIPDLYHWLNIVFGLNWVLLLFNLVPAFPMDGGRILRSLLWPYIGFERSTRIAVQAAKIFALAFGVIGLWYKQFLLMGVAVFVYFSAEMERRMLEAGMLFDDTLFGYDFSQGYTSLQQTSKTPKARRPGLWEQWRRRRARIRRQRKQEVQEEQERHMDEILAKLHRDGMASLTDQERRFLSRVSAKYRARDD